MKTILSIFLLIIFCSIVKAQQKEYYKESFNLKGPNRYPEEIQFQILIKKIMHDYGKTFMYFNELQKGLFKFEGKNKEGYFLQIINSNEQITKSFQLYKEKIKGVYMLSFRKEEIEKYLLPIMQQKLINEFFNPHIETIIERNSILLDKVIIPIPDYRDFKVFNRSFALEHLVDQEGNPCPLYELLGEGKILPYFDSSASEYVPKVVSIDPLKHNIIYGDQNYDIYSGEYVSKFYCNQGNDYNELSFPTGIAFGSAYVTGNYTVYPIFVADQHNGRIVKSNFKINNDGGAAFFDESSFEIFSKNVYLPYDVELFESSAGSNNKIWVSEYFDNGTLVCLNSDGTIDTKIKGFRYSNDYGQTWWTFPFKAGSKMRIAIYEPMNCFAFVYNSPGNSPYDNEICTFLLDSNGIPLSMYNDTIVNGWREHFNSDYPLTSVNFQNIRFETSQYPYMWITTGGFNPPDPYKNMVHAFAINSTANFAYLGSTGKPRNTDWYFHNLLNTTTGLGYYDLYTVEEWNDTYGLRKYYPFADFHSVEIKNYCEDSTNMMEWNAAFTNDCFIKFWVERKKNASEWEPVEIKQIDGINQPPGTFNPIIFRFKGYTALNIEEDPIEIKLNLPLKDYSLGGQLRLQARLYPDYDPSGSGEYTPTPVYEINTNKTCLPKPGGCPFLYVKDENQDYTADNNLLHKSEFSMGGDITDKYKLQVTPYMDSRDNTVEMYIVENENDAGYINMVKLYAVDYPDNKKMAVTENNEIVLYDSATVLASDNAILNGEIDITNYINFHNPDTISGHSSDSIYAHFTNPDKYRIKRNVKADYSNRGVNNDRGNQKTGEKTGKYYQGKSPNNAKQGPGGSYPPIAFISKLGNLTNPNPSAKQYAGLLTASSIYSNEVQAQFTRRERSSVIVLPLFNDTDKVDHLFINWQSDFEMNYLGIASLQYDGFTSTEAPLSEGKYITLENESSIIDNLLYVDTLYGNVSSSGLIKMKFDVSNLPALGENQKREYVIEVNGRYVSGTDNFNKVVQNQIPLTYSLSQNYPNPFNPITKINYEIPKTLKVNLVIYDILGREVKRLVNNEFKEAGRYTVEFDGKNYASGVYFYRIESGSFVVAKKMVLVK